MKIKVNIPTDLSEITLGQYQRYLEVLKENQDTKFLLDKTIQIFCNVNLSDILLFKYNDVIDIISKIESLFKEEQSLTTTFDLNGTSFGFIPKLENMTFDEVSNTDDYISDWSNMHRAMAILYRPIQEKGKNKTYSIVPYKGTVEYADSMKEMPLNIVLGANVFFWNLSNDLLKASLNYLQKITQETTTVLPNSVKNGDGMPAYMHSLAEVCSILKQLQEQTFMSA